MAICGKRGHYLTLEEAKYGCPKCKREREGENSGYLIPIRCPRCNEIMQHRPLFAGNMPVEGNQVCERCFKEAGVSDHISRSERAKLEGPSELIDIERLSRLLNPKSEPIKPPKESTATSAYGINAAYANSPKRIKPTISKPLLSPGSTPAEIRKIERRKSPHTVPDIVCVFLFLLTITIGVLAQV